MKVEDNIFLGIISETVGGRFLWGTGMMREGN